MLVRSFTIDFGTPNNARYFFNSGGSIRFNASRTGGTSTSQNQAWANLLSSMGTISFNYNSTKSSTNAGTGSSIGFYQLTSTMQQVYTRTGSGAYVSAYNANDYTVTMSCDVLNNSEGGARYVYVTAAFNDDHTSVWKDSVTGTLTHNVQMRRATGTNVDVIAPTAVNTVLLSN